MSARLRRAATVAAATAIGLSLAVAPASAESRTFRDVKGDTWNVAAGSPEKDSGHPEADLRKVTFNHTARKVVITARMQNLRKAGEAVGIVAVVDTPADGSYNLDLVGTPDDWHPELNFSGFGSDCSATGSLDYRKDVVKVVIPRSCLARPETVRFRLGGYFMKNSDKAFYDDATGKKTEFGYTRRLERG